MTRIELTRTVGDYGFEGKDANGHTMTMDAAVEIGGQNAGVRPMQTLLMGLGGCSGIDIISILKKQKQEVETVKMIIDAEREQGKEPSLWKYVHIRFQFTGTVDSEKAFKACALSIDKYCSVAATLRAAGATIEWESEVIK
ncbi:MAG: OsmC family protein [Chitinophagaceae bacterium]|nr:OsmC family protein [Chitinophagaceae bacterium]